MFNFLSNIFVDFLIILYSNTGSLGISIILLTLIIKSLFVPISTQAIINSLKIKKLQPEFEKLRKKYKNDQKKFLLEQTKLYQKYDIKPLSGCLPQIIQLIVFFSLYKAFRTFLAMDSIKGVAINPYFLWFDVVKPDYTKILAFFVLITQLLYSFSMMPDILEKIKQKQKLSDSQLNQLMMVLVMPIITALISTRLPAGLSIYWITATLFSLVQQFFILKSFKKKLK